MKSSDTKKKKKLTQVQRSIGVPMRDDNAINPMHLKQEFRATNSTKTSNRLCPARHLPCTINRVIQRLHQSEGDGNCFYWSIMIAMKLVPSGLSADSIELYESEAAKRQIQDMRTKMLTWWRNRPLEQYKFGRRWMISLEDYYKRYAKETAQKIESDCNGLKLSWQQTLQSFWWMNK